MANTQCIPTPTKAAWQARRRQVDSFSRLGNKVSQKPREFF